MEKLTALDVKGQPVDLVRLAEGGPVLIASLRHFG